MFNLNYFKINIKIKNYFKPWERISLKILFIFSLVFPFLLRIEMEINYHFYFISLYASKKTIKIIFI